MTAALLDSLNGYLPLAASILAVLLLLSWHFLRVPMDEREPPLFQPTVPVIGHLLGMIQYHHKYYQMLSEKYSVPIFTIPIFRSKMYIIADTQLMQVVMRTKTLSMDPVIIEASPKLAGFSKRATALMHNEDSGFMRQHYKLFNTALLPGPSLNELNLRVLTQLADTVNKVGNEWETKPSMFLWLRDDFSYAVGKSLFGKNSPLDYNVIRSFWEFEKNQLKAVIGLPYFLARRTYQAREVVVCALRRYFDAGHDQDASWFFENRTRISRSYGITNHEIGNFDLTIVGAATGNAAPTIFWMLSFILNDPGLVDELRAEIEPTITKEKGKATIDINKFNTHCPLLVSVYQEVLRLINRQSGIRLVLSDTLISANSGDRTYLLKKGCIVQMPSIIPHTSKAAWGPTVDDFSPRRFLKTSEKVDKAQKQSYIPFGGGKHLCPGRYLAFAEIMGLTAAAIVGLEFMGTDGGRFKMVGERWVKFGEAISKPVGKGLELGVRVKRRTGWEDVTWAFVGGNDGGVEIGAE